MSSVIASQEALLGLLQALDLEGVHVDFIGSGKLPKTNEILLVLPAKNYRKMPGEQFDVETYDLMIRVEVFRSGETTAAACDARRWELIDLVEGELRRTDFRGYYTHGGEVLVEDDSLDLYDKGWVAVSEVSFGCAVRQA